VKRLHLVRHAPAEWPEGEEPRYRGSSDAPLGERGRWEARLLAGRFAAEEIDAVYASDLTRARETAEGISAPLGLPVRLRPGFRELDFGEWEGASHEELLRRAGERYTGWLASPERVAPPGGETLVELQERVERSFEVLVDASEGEGGVVLVGHGGPLRLILCRLLGMPPGNHWRLGLEHSSVTTLEGAGPDSEPVLRAFNDRSHLIGAAAP
jgi:alpha-ribazole phosphatase